MSHLLSLLRFSLGGPLEGCLTDGTIDWHAVYEEAKRQCILGITYAGVERLSHLDTTPPGQWTTENIDKKGSLKPPLPLLLDWMGQARLCERQNLQLNERCAELCTMVAADGFQSAIIKGQGLAAIYDASLSNLRTPGDIDIWLEGSRTDIIRYVRSKIAGKEVDISPLHIEMPIYEDIIVEVHFQPSTLNAPLACRRLRHIFRQQAYNCFANEITTPDGHAFTAATIEFDVIQVLCHILSHFLYEGIGLRQIIDYYYVLLRRDADSDSMEPVLRSLGLWRFTRALMYVLHDSLGLPEEYLIAPPDEHHGRFLLAEILEGGNFGKSSALVNDANHSRPLWRFVQHTRRQLRFLPMVPGEILWSPYRRLATYLWRLCNGYFK